MHFDTNSASRRCGAFVQACVIAHLRAQSQLDTKSPPDAPCAREKRRFRLPTLMHTSQHSTHAAGALLLGLFRPLTQHLPRSARRTLLLRSPLTRSESVFSNIIHRPFRPQPPRGVCTRATAPYDTHVRGLDEFTHAASVEVRRCASKVARKPVSEAPNPGKCMVALFSKS